MLSSGKLHCPPESYLCLPFKHLCIMLLSHEAFINLIAPTGPDISIYLYHECLHSIAFTHTKMLSIPCHKFIDPDSPSAANNTVSVHLLPHWHRQLLLSLFTCLLHLYIKLQLCLTDDDLQHILSSFDDLSASDLDDVLSLSLKQLGHHLHILRSVSFLDLLCNWKSIYSPLDFCLHIGGTPMIVLGDILICNDVQHTLSCLLRHVGSPPRPKSSLDWHSSRSQSHSSQSKSKSQSSKSLSIGLRTSTHISVPVQKLAPTLVGSSTKDIASLVVSPSLVSSLSLIPSPSLVPSSSPVSSPSLVPSPSSASSFHHCLHDMHHIHALQLVAGEGIPCNITNVPFDDTSTYKTHDSIKTSLFDIGMTHVAYHLQDGIDLDNVVSVIDHAEAAALTINNLKESNDYLNSIASMINVELCNPRPTILIHSFLIPRCTTCLSLRNISSSIASSLICSNSTRMLLTSPLALQLLILGLKNLISLGLRVCILLKNIVASSTWILLPLL